MPGAEFDLRSAVVDASVVVRWVVPEKGAPEALALLARSIDWLAPRLMLSEVASALRRKVIAGELTAALAAQGLEFVLGIIARGALRLHRDETVIGSALALSIALQHKVPDCLYLALAEDTGAGLATADLRLNEIARMRQVRTVLVPSA
jgi:predicted nucleic acid-binding protein